MSVTFVYRCPYEGPAEKAIVHFDDATVLDWFRNRWEQMSDALGMEVYGFRSLAEAIAEQDLPPPEHPDELRQLLDAHLYVEGEILFEEHCIQVVTDDDELGMAYYFFDDRWLDRYPDRAVFLSHEDWRLPVDIDPYAPPFSPMIDSTPLPGGPEGEGPERGGAVYILLSCYYDGSNMDGATPISIPHIRLDTLPAWLAVAKPTDDWPFELLFLRSQLLVAPPNTPPRERELLAMLTADPCDGGAWAVYSDWLMQQGRPAAHVMVLQRAFAACAAARFSEWAGNVWPRNDILTGDLADARDEATSLVAQYTKKLEPHDMPVHIASSKNLAQICLPAFPSLGTWHQWILFDDRWAASHSALADCAMRYIERWDVLTVE